MDYYAIFRITDALAGYTFSGNLTARNIALGNGSLEQIDMGTQLKPLFSTDNPSPVYGKGKYKWPCDTIINERQQNCQNVTYNEKTNIDKIKLTIYPNPATNQVHIDCPDCKIKKIKLYSIYGKQVSEYLTNDFSLSHLSNGVYLVFIELDKSFIISKLIKN